jgi:hypothetical protein
MTMRTGATGFCVGLLMSAIVGAQVKYLPSATTEYGGFGLPDLAGARLLVLPAHDGALRPDLLQPELLKTAFCADGVRASVQFERRQAAGASTNGRQSSKNFDAMAGSVFNLLGGKVEADTQCFLASEALMAGSTVLEVGAPAGVSACAQTDRFATLRTRPVTHCWPIARVGGREVVLLEFERRGTDALASLVLVDGARTVFSDMPAKFHAEGEELWRVDDGGALSAEDIHVICAFQRGNGYTLGVAWGGAEGWLLSLLVSEGDRFTGVLSEYWYAAPI